MTIVKKFTESRSEQMNWKVVEKSGGHSKYKGMYDLNVIVLPKAKDPRFAITPSLKKALGNPEYIMLLVNMPFVAITSANSGNKDAFRLSMGGRESGQMGHITCKKFIKDIGLQYPYTVYFECEKEGDLFYFDTNKPCKI